jgi:hypothetical protein
LRRRAENMTIMGGAYAPPDREVDSPAKERRCEELR